MLKVFVDASFSPITRRAVGCYLFNNKLNFHYMENTKNTQAEIETVLMMMHKMPYDKDITVYTDCMAVIKLFNERYLDKELKAPREALSSLMRLHHNIIFQKITGHMKSCLKDENDRLFSIVDKAARAKLRENNVING
jgi:ribonuclease HI